MQNHLWKSNVDEFNNIAELRKHLYELSAMEKNGECEVKKVFRSPDKVYFVWWKSST